MPQSSVYHECQPLSGAHAVPVDRQHAHVHRDFRSAAPQAAAPLRPIGNNGELCSSVLVL